MQLVLKKRIVFRSKNYLGEPTIVTNSLHTRGNTAVVTSDIAGVGSKHHQNFCVLLDLNTDMGKYRAELHDLISFALPEQGLISSFIAEH